MADSGRHAEGVASGVVEAAEEPGRTLRRRGHTPHGNAPTVVQSSGVTLIMGDTSFSDLKPIEPAFKGDTRGAAASEIHITDGMCGVRGRTEKGQIIHYAVC